MERYPPPHVPHIMIVLPTPKVIQLIDNKMKSIKNAQIKPPYFCFASCEYLGRLLNLRMRECNMLPESQEP